MAEDDNDDPRHFNPHEDREKRKQVRFEYRELISETEKNSLEFTKPDSRGLHKALDRAEELFNDVKQTREAVLDSKFLVLASKLGRVQAQKLQTHLVKFDADIFAQKLITLMGGRSVEQAARQTNSDDDDDDGVDATSSSSRNNRRRIQNLDWSKLGKMSTPRFRRTPAVTFMFGPLSIAPPVKRVRQANGGGLKKDRPTAADKVTPSQLNRVESQEEATTSEVQRVYKYLAEATAPEGSDEDINPVCLFKFIVNPDSFSQTIENMFHLSFLIKDGRARIDLDKDTGLPFVEPCEPFQEDQCPNTVMRKQVITHLSLAEYREIVQVFNIKKPMIPTRTSLAPGSSGLPNGFHGNDDDHDDDDDN